MKRVSRQEFQRYTSKYLKEVPLIITNRGEDDLIIKSISDSSKVATLVEKTIPVKKFGEHGCGCKKVEGKFLCKIHGRV